MRENHPDVVKTAAGATSCASASISSQQPIGPFSIWSNRNGRLRLSLTRLSFKIVADPEATKKQRRSNEVAGLQTKPSAGQMFVSGPNAARATHESKHSSAEVFDSSGPLECFMVALRPPAVTCTSARGSLSAGGFRALVRRPSLHLQCRSKRGAGRKNRLGLLSVMSCHNIGLLNWLGASHLNFVNGDAHVVAPALVPHQQGCCSRTSFTLHIAVVRWAACLKIPY